MGLEPVSLEKQSQQQERLAGTKQFVVDVCFLLERYHGAEWPPSPRRLFLALVAALYQSPSGRFDINEADKALQYLERQRPPRIESVGQEGTEYTLFVPNNDMDLVSKDYAKHGRSEKDLKKYSTAKNMRPHIARAVRYSWTLDYSKDRHTATSLLCELAREVPVLGLGIDPVAMNGSLCDNTAPLAGAQEYLPDDGDGASQADLKIDVPLDGMLEDAKRRHSEFLKRITESGFVKPRPIACQVSCGYRRRGAPKPKIVVFKTIDVESNRFVPGSAVADLVSKINERYSSDLGDASVIVMPSIGDRNSDAMVRRVGIMIPPSMDSQSVERLQNCIDADFVEVKGIKFQFKIIGDLDKDGVSRTYMRKSTVWRSITPFEAEDVEGSTGDKHSAANCILRELTERGLKDSVVSIRLDKIPDWHGLERMRNGSNLWYAEIEFKSPVSGPLLLGTGTRQGNGLLAPAMLPDVAYYEVVGKRPPVTRTVKVAEAVRVSVMSKAGRLHRGWLPQSLSGHDSAGKPLREGHAHAFWLPVDNDGDGWIDHVAVYARHGLEPSTRRAFQTTIDVRDERASIARLRFDGFYRAKDMGKQCVIFDKSKTWTTATPYYTPWHAKKNFGVPEQIRKEVEWRRVQIADVKHEVRASMQTGSCNIPARMFDATRSGRTPPHGTARRVTISFTGLVDGPILLGGNSHFGLGMFVPSSDPNTRRAP